MKNGTNKDKGRVTMADVARAVGVSHMTVSRVLRDPVRVQPGTRQRVEEAIRRIGYVPDLVASALVTKRTNIIAMILPTVSTSIFTDAIKGASDVAREAGLQIIVAESGYSLEREEQIVASLLGHKPMGMMIVGVTHTARTIEMLDQSGVPVVETWDQAPDPIDSIVGFSNHDAGRAMTDALIELGYRDIVFVGAGLDEARSRKRYAGYQEAMRAAGLAIPPSSTLTEWVSVRSGVAFARQLVEASSLPQALFFLNDAVATGALLEFLRLGIRVPEEVAVAGFGGFDYSEFLVPSLTTVEIERYAIGASGARIIIERAQGAPAIIKNVGFKVMLREST